MPVNFSLRDGDQQRAGVGVPEKCGGLNAEAAQRALTISCHCGALTTQIPGTFLSGTTACSPSSLWVTQLSNSCVYWIE